MWKENPWQPKIAWYVSCDRLLEALFYFLYVYLLETTIFCFISWTSSLIFSVVLLSSIFFWCAFFSSSLIFLRCFLILHTCIEFSMNNLVKIFFVCFWRKNNSIFNRTLHIRELLGGAEVQWSGANVCGWKAWNFQKVSKFFFQKRLLCAEKIFYLRSTSGIYIHICSFTNLNVYTNEISHHFDTTKFWIFGSTFSLFWWLL